MRGQEGEGGCGKQGAGGLQDRRRRRVVKKTFCEGAVIEARKCRMDISRSNKKIERNAKQYDRIGRTQRRFRTPVKFHEININTHLNMLLLCSFWFYLMQNNFSFDRAQFTQLVGQQYDTVVVSMHPFFFELPMCILHVPQASKENSRRESRS